MAIAYDNSAYDTALTHAYTCSGSNRILFVGINGNVNSDDVTGVTYNGVAMTQINKALASSGDRYVYLYGLVGPASGSNDVVISGPPGAVQSFKISYTGALQSGLPDAQGTNTALSVTSISKAITTVLDNCWVVCMFSLGGNGAVATVTTGTKRIDPGNNPIGMGDSNGAVTPAGSYTTTVTQNGAAANATLLVASFGPAADTVNSNMLSIL